MHSADTIDVLLQPRETVRELPVAEIQYDFSQLTPESRQRLGVVYLENVLGLPVQTILTLVRGKDPASFEPDYDGFMTAVSGTIPGAHLDLESFGRIAELYARHILGATLETAAEAAERRREMDLAVKYFQARREAIAAQYPQRSSEKLNQFWTEISQVIQLPYSVDDLAAKGLPEVDSFMTTLQSSGFEFFDKVFGDGLTHYRWPYSANSTVQTRQ